MTLFTVITFGTNDASTRHSATTLFVSVVDSWCVIKETRITFTKLARKHLNCRAR